MAKTLKVLDHKGQEVEKLELPEEVFGQRVNTALLHQAVIMYQASLRQGNAATKTRGEVRGGGKKPWRQKGTGRARAGSSRSPLWKGGGVVFGPHPRDYAYSISKKMKRLALAESLNAKYHAESLLCLEEFKNPLLKTKEFAKVLDVLNLRGKVLALLDGSHKSVGLVTRNIPRFELLRCEDVNAYDILKNKTLILTKTAFNKLLERIEKA
ncbi:MAG: 50S ribosomal protein L4 [Candidatus Omnitrophica bacterium]|nr:50S ribosomal protein L4 [Candidatus Omnitrophota bacterium]